MPTFPPVPDPSSLTSDVVMASKDQTITGVKDFSHGATFSDGPIVIVHNTYWLGDPANYPVNMGPTVQAILNGYATAGYPSVKIVSAGKLYKFASGISIPQVGASNRTIAVVLEGQGYMQDGFFDTNEGTVWLANGLAGDMVTSPSATCFSFLGIQQMTFTAKASLGGSMTSGHMIHPYALQEGWMRDVGISYAFGDGYRPEQISPTINCDINHVDHCRIEHCGGNGVAYVGVTEGAITSSHFEANDIGANIAGSGDCAIMSSTFDTHTTNGIQIGGIGSQDCRVIGNFVQTTGHEGISLQNISRALLLGNYVHDNGRLLGTDRKGIRIYNSTYCIIQSEIVTDTGTGYQLYGIYEEGASDNNNINNCDVRGNITANMTLVGANTVARANRGYNPVGAVTTPGFPASTVVITNTTGSDVTSYITNGTSALTVQVDAVTALMVIPANGTGTVRIPAGSTFKPTYGGGAPTHKWYGE